MSREIVEAVRAIEREKGIEEDTLIRALEDALLAAYKKTPGASRHATVELDPQEGEFRVFAIELPPDVEERLMDEAREREVAIRGAVAILKRTTFHRLGEMGASGARFHERLIWQRFTRGSGS